MQACAGPIIESTIEIYQEISKQLRPTPARFHYLFNLRDVAKVIQGILMTRPQSIQNADSMQKLWVHEASRIFYDRLINDTDKEWFTTIVCELLSRSFRSGLEFDDVFGEKKVIFSDIIKVAAEASVILYEEMKDPNKLKKVLTEKLEDYNISASNRMSLVFFEDAIHHICRILRVLRQPRGNVMLIGVGGSGKQSLTRLSSFVYEQTVR